MPLTIPRSRPSCSRTGPCSMWSSRYAPTRSTAFASPSRSNSKPPAAIASATPRRRQSSESRSPMNARLPSIPVWKRLPSSSLNDTIQGGRRSETPSRLSVRTTSSAARTPSAPSYRPPRGTVSRWEPSRTAVPSPSSQRPRTLPAASICVSSPSSWRRPTSHSFACANSGVQAKRETPPPSAPIRAASSRSDASEDTALPQPPVELDGSGDAEGDHESLPWLLLEGLAPEVAEERGVRRPQEPGRDVEEDEATPAHLEQAACERDRGSTPGYEAADEYQIATSLLDLLLGPVDALSPLSREEAVHEPVADSAADHVRRVVAQDRAGGRDEDDGEEDEVPCRGEDPREDDRRLARHEWKHDVQCRNAEEECIRPRRARDVVGQRLEQLVRVLHGEAEATCRAFLPVELDEDGRLVADDPGVVAGLDRDHLRCHVVELAAVCVFAADVAAGEEAHVSVHAEVGLDVLGHVGRPAKAGRIDGALDASVRRSDGVDLGTPDLAVVGAFDRVGKRIHAASLDPRGRNESPCEPGGTPDFCSIRASPRSSPRFRSASCGSPARPPSESSPASPAWPGPAV